MHRYVAALCLALFTASVCAQAPEITKVDPPNWWVNMPAPMLLLQGDHLTGAHFSLAGSHQHTAIARTRRVIGVDRVDGSVGPESSMKKRASS